MNLISYTVNNRYQDTQTKKVLLDTITAIPEVLKDPKPSVNISELADSIKKQDAMLISIVAGVEVGTIENWLGGKYPIVRCMPNTPAMVGAGASALFANSQVSNAQKEIAESITYSIH